MMLPYHNIGEIVTFGDYDWYVIKELHDGYYELLCKDIINQKKYNETWEEVNWETSTLCSWLNNDFYNEFNQKEKGLIINRRINESTDGYVRLLNKIEASRLDKNILKASSEWWVNMYDYKQRHQTATINSDGTVNNHTISVEKVKGVRPVITIKLNSK